VEQPGFPVPRPALLRLRGVQGADARALAQVGRVRSIDDLPDDRTLIRILRVAAKLNEDGVKLPRRRPSAKLDGCGQGPQLEVRAR